MVKMKFIRWLTTVLAATVLVLFSAQLPAAVTAHVDRNPVALDESFTLTVESDGGSGKPDFSVLQRDFELMGQSSNSTVQIINGQMSRKQQWLVGLMAKQAGQFQIPAFDVGGEQSKPLPLTVVAAKQPQAQQNSDLFMEVSATPQQLYVQQQLLYTVRLYYSVNMASGSTLSEPGISGANAVIEKLGDNRQYQTSVNGRRYGVLEQQYAIYPQKSGPLTIEPLTFEGNVVEQGRSNFFDPFSQTTRTVRLRSKAVKLDVLPAPPGITTPWLPARSIQLLEQWSEDPPRFVVGEPVTRTLAVMAEGLTAAQLPNVGEAVPDGVKSYPDQPQLKDTKDANGITGLRQQKIALIPTAAGELTLPAIELHWWNVEKKQLEVARLPQRTVTVAPGSGVASAPARQIPAQSMVTDPTALAALAEVTSSTTTTAAGWWPWLSLLLGSAWLITLIAWWRQRRAPVVQAAVMTTAPGQQNLRPLEQQLKKAAQQNSAQQSQAALLAWARARWPQQPPVSLPAIARRCAPELAEVITALDRALYANGEGGWQGQPLWQAFERHRPAAEVVEKVTGAGLEPLYRA